MWCLPWVYLFLRSLGQLGKHHLATRNGQCLSGLILLLYEIIDSLHYVRCGAASVHRDLRLVEALHVGDGLGARHLAAAQVLGEKAILRVGPQRAVEEIT